LPPRIGGRSEAAGTEARKRAGGARRPGAASVPAALLDEPAPRKDAGPSGAKRETSRRERRTANRARTTAKSAKSPENPPETPRRTRRTRKPGKRLPRPEVAAGRVKAVGQEAGAWVRRSGAPPSFVAALHQTRTRRELKLTKAARALCRLQTCANRPKYASSIFAVPSP